MITIKCPVRISLIGGSSDLDAYLNKHNKGSVISFTPNLYTYVSVYRDILGKNNMENKYIINYSKREEVIDKKNIQNDLVREYLHDIEISPFSIHMTSDIFSVGSGLAISSSYSCGLVKAISELNEQKITEIECAIRAHNLEKKINPLLGYQDVFGCCIGGFKKITFQKNKLPTYTFLSSTIFNYFDAYLYYTGYCRNSTDILKDVYVPETDVFNPLVELGETYLLNEEYEKFMEVLNEGWKEKKRTGKTILQNPKIEELDNYIGNIDGCVSHKLCGAGNGGFFLSFFKKGVVVPVGFHKIELSANGIERVI